jgi:hypothetical protein
LEKTVVAARQADWSELRFLVVDKGVIALQTGALHPVWESEPFRLLEIGKDAVLLPLKPGELAHSSGKVRVAPIPEAGLGLDLLVKRAGQLRLRARVAEVGTASLRPVRIHVGIGSAEIAAPIVGGWATVAIPILPGVHRVTLAPADEPSAGRIELHELVLDVE